MIRELTERLRSNGQVSSEDIDAALRAKAVNGGSLALNLVLRGAIDEELLADFYCEFGGLRRASAGEIDSVGHEVFGLVPIEIVYDTGIVPLHLVSEERLAVGVVDPTEPERIEEAEFFAGYAFEPRVISVTQMAGLFERLAGHPWKVPLDELARALHARSGRDAPVNADDARDLFRILAELEPLLEARMSDFDPRRSVTVQIEALDDGSGAWDLTEAHRSGRSGRARSELMDSWEAELVDAAPDDVVELSPDLRKSAVPPPPVPVEARSSRGSGARARSRGESEVRSGVQPSVDARGVIVSDSLVGVAAVEAPWVAEVDRSPFQPDRSTVARTHGDAASDVLEPSPVEGLARREAADADAAPVLTPAAPLPDAPSVAARGVDRGENRPAPEHPTQRTMRLTGADRITPRRAAPADTASAASPRSDATAPATGTDTRGDGPPITTPPSPAPTDAHASTDADDSSTWDVAEPGASLRSTDAPQVPSTRRPELHTPGEHREPRFVPTRGGGDVSDFQGHFGPSDGVLERTGAPTGATRAAFRIAARALASVESRDDIATELAESLGLAYPNVFVLSLRLPQVVIWGASIERGTDQLIGERFHVQPGSVWERVVSESVAFHGRLAVRDPLRKMLGRDLGDETLVLPLTMKRRTVALLVLDSAARPQLPPAAGQFAGLARAVHDAFRRVILSQKRSLRKA